MRFAFWTDLHLSGQTPRHRVDDYQFALISKIHEVYKAAHRDGADFVVCGGDTFDAHRMFSYSLLGKLMDMLCGYNIDTYFAVGQHDIHGYNPWTYQSSTLCFMISRSSQLHLLDEEEPRRVGDIELRPSHVWNEPKEAAEHTTDDNAVSVLVAHHLLTNKSTVFDTVSTTDFASWMHEGQARYDMVLSGDLHDGYSPHEVDDMWFCNPGSMARRAISDMHRTPCYAIIDVEPGAIPVIDVRELQSAQPGHEVFEETAAELLRKQGEGHDLSQFDASAFVNEMEQFEAQSANICDLIQKAGHSKGLRPEVMKYLAKKSKETT